MITRIKTSFRQSSLQKRRMGQLNLHWNLGNSTKKSIKTITYADTSLQCNFSLIGGKSTGTYCFKTVFNGLTKMPAEFQRTMDSIFLEISHAYAFIDDILVDTKESEIDHISTVKKILRKLDKENMSLKLGLRVAGAQNYTDGNYTVGAENRTDRKLRKTADVVTAKVFYGLNP